GRSGPRGRRRPPPTGRRRPGRRTGVAPCGAEPLLTEWAFSQASPARTRAGGRSPRLQPPRPVGVKGRPDLTTRARALLSLLQKLDRPLQPLVLAFADALDRRSDFDMRHQAEALKLPAIRVANVVPPEPHGEPARKDRARDVAVGTRCVAADEGRAASRLQEQ